MNKIDYPVIDTKISFSSDVQNNKDFLKSQISYKSVLIIGGAGTIGSSYIKQILKYKPSKITVVDINENGLTELTRVLIY
jgi:FlaA1/EpsC-like NDP-sugar epimerase